MGPLVGQSRSAMVLGRSTMVLGRCTMALGSSSMVLGRSTMVFLSVLVLLSVLVKRFCVSHMRDSKSGIDAVCTVLHINCLKYTVFDCKTHYYIVLH